MVFLLRSTKEISSLSSLHRLARFVSDISCLRSAKLIHTCVCFMPLDADDLKVTLVYFLFQHLKNKYIIASVYILDIWQSEIFVNFLNSLLTIFPLNPSENIRCLFRNLKLFQNLHWTWSKWNCRASTLSGITANLSTLKKYLCRTQWVNSREISTKISPKPPPNIWLLFGNTKRFCLKVWFYWGAGGNVRVYTIESRLFSDYIYPAVKNSERPFHEKSSLGSAIDLCEKRRVYNLISGIFYKQKLFLCWQVKRYRPKFILVRKFRAACAMIR